MLKMLREFAIVSLLALQLGMAAPPASPCATVAPPPAGALPPAVAPVVGTTTPAGLTPLQKGLIGAGVGVAGLAAIGGIAGALAQKKITTTLPHPTMPHPTIPHPPVTHPVTTIAFTTTGSIQFQKPAEDEGSSSSWLLPVLLGLLLLCCLLGIIGYFCMGSKRSVKKSTKKKPAPAQKPAPKPAPAPAKDIEVAPLAEAVPLMAGHWEQPMATVPVTTAQSSYVPGSTYVETVAPTYAMAAPTYATTPIVETVAPTYAVGTTPMMAATAPTAVVGTMGYSMPGYATTGTTGYSMPGYATSATTGYSMPGYTFQ